MPVGSMDRARLEGLQRAFVRLQHEHLSEARASFERALRVQGRRMAALIEAGDSPELGIDSVAFARVYAGLYQEIVPLFARRTYERLERVAQRSLVIAGRQVDDELYTFWQQWILSFLSEEGAARVKAISETTLLWLRGFITEAATEGWGPRATAREMLRRWDGLAEARAERIARTELNSAANRGSLLGAETIGERLGIPIRKHWVSALRKPRDSHVAAHAQYATEGIPVGEMFVVGGEMMRAPGDFGAPASEVVNCECGLNYSVPRYE